MKSNITKAMEDLNLSIKELQEEIQEIQNEEDNTFKTTKANQIQIKTNLQEIKDIRKIIETLEHHLSTYKYIC